MSSSNNVRGGYLNLAYNLGGSNLTMDSGEGPGEYVFNGWINTKSRNGMPTDLFHGNGHFGRTIAGFSPSLGLVVVVRINRRMIPRYNSVTAGPIMQNIHLLVEAVGPKADDLNINE